MLISLARSGRALILVVVCSLLANARGHTDEPPVKAPEGFRLVSPEEWQKIQEKLAQLDALLKAEKPIEPSSCKVTGKVEGDVAHLQAKFGFGTLRPRTPVLLGCGQGKPSAVTLDGQSTSGLAWSDTGWSVLVDKDGNHEIVMDMDVPLDARDLERGFELTLPKIPIRQIDLQLPAQAKNVRVSNKGVTASPVDEHTVRVEARFLATEKMEISWEPAGARPSAIPSFSVDGRMLVRLGTSTVQTQAALTIRTLTGQPEQIRVFVPGQADKPAALDGPFTSRVLSIDPDTNAAGWWIVKLKGPSTEPVHLDVSWSQVRSGNSVTVIPAVVAAAARHRGVVLVSKAADMQIRSTPRTDTAVTVTPREISDDDRKPAGDGPPGLRDPNVAASFFYWQLLNPDKPATPPTPLVQVDVEKIKPVIEAHIVHNFMLVPHLPDGLAWRLRTQFDLTFAQTSGAEVLLVQLPVDFTYDEKAGIQPTLSGSAVELIPDKHQLRIALEKVTSKMSLAFEGEYTSLPPDAAETTVKLPVPLGMLDRGADVKIEVPRNFKLVRAGPDDPTWDPILADIRPDPGKSLQKHSWTARRTPELARFAWGQNPPEVQARNRVALFLSERQIHVVHKLNLQLGQGSADRLLLNVPTRLVKRIELIGADGKKQWLTREGQWEFRRDGAEFYRLELRPDAARGGLTLKYFIDLENDADDRARPGDIAVPLVMPEKVNDLAVSDLETIAEIYARPGVAVTAAPPKDSVPPGGNWLEMGSDAGSTEDADAPRRRAAPPSLAVRAHGANVPLILRVADPAPHSLLRPIVEAMLVRVRLDDDGLQTYQVGLRLGPLRTPALDIDLPAPPAEIGFRAFVRRTDMTLQALNWRADGTTARLELDPEATLAEAILEVEYNLKTPGSGMVRWRATFQPPQVRGDLGDGPVQWLVSLPSRRLPLVQQGGSADETRWGIRGWLFGPKPARSADALERWLTGSNSPDAAPDASLVLLGAGPVNISVVHLPESWWLLGCSLLLVAWAMGLWLSWGKARSGSTGYRLAFWTLLVAVAVGCAATVLFWPALIIAIGYGLQPGLVILCVVAVVQWIVQRRYQRRVVFMPGFQRLKSDSSLVRSSHERKRSESSKIDLPPIAAGAWSNGTPAPQAEPASAAQPGGTP